MVQFEIANGEMIRQLDREWLTMTRMVEIYCSTHHQETAGPRCTEWQVFLDHADLRFWQCPYGGDKPTCSNCPMHCYKPGRREQAKAIMRYAAPRMLLRHPLRAIARRLDGFRKAGHPRELTRHERRADPSIYMDRQRRPELTRLVQDQAAIKGEIQTLESNWPEAGEALDATD